MKLTTIDLLTGTRLMEQSEKLKTTIECKFVLISNSTEHNLIFGPLHEYNYHANLVEKFCIERNIESGTKEKHDLYEISDKSLTINGGGWFKIDFTDNSVTALNISTAYGRFNETILDLFIQNNKIFNGFQIKIRD